MAVKLVIESTAEGRGFLSRLCGGEVEDVPSTNAYRFLSRLCGGEEIFFAVLVKASISKPPMWR